MKQHKLGTVVNQEVNIAKYYSEYSLGEEIANTLIHGLGALLSVAGLTVMLIVAMNSHDQLRVISALVYGISLVVLFCVSTIYHGLPGRRAKKIMQIVDHMAIYLLIAGTYTPVLLLSIKGVWGYSMLVTIWCLALFGIAFKMVYKLKHPRISMFTYLAMAWCCLIVIPKFIANVPANALWLLLIGGIVYTVGTIFYSYEKIPFNHAIWHVFVLGGAACHFFAVFLYVITPI